MSSHAARCAVLFACAVLLLAAAPLRATVIVVDSLDTTTLPSDACSIFDAFYAVEHGTAYGTCPAGSGDDVIVLPQGAVFEFARAWPEGGSGSDAVAVIAGDVVLVGNGATLKSLMSPCSSDPPPENQFRWFDVFTTGHLSLFDVTLAGGCAVGLGSGASGGSIYVSGVLELDHVTIRDSAADFAGGAIEAPQGSTLTVRDSTFVGNGGRYSHGGAIDSGGDTTVTGAYFGGNYASDGSAIASIFGEVRILNSVFADNRADSGAVSLGSAEIGFSTFSGNDGGAVKAVGDVTITASVFSGGRGGNRSETCMFYATPPVIDAASVSDDPSCAPMAVADRADIALGDLGDYGGPIPVFPLLPGSVAIDDSQCLFGNVLVFVDARRALRPWGANCDAGAYEFDGVDRSPPPQHFSPGNVLLSFADRVSEYTRAGERVRDAWYPWRAPSDFRMSGIDVENLDTFRVALGEFNPALGRYRVDQDRWTFAYDPNVESFPSGTSVTHAGARWFMGDVRHVPNPLPGVVVFENDTIVDTIPSAGEVMDVTVGKDGMLYVLAADVPGNAVRKYDPQSLAPLGSFNLFQAAGAGGNALAVDAAGNVYVAETALAPIVRFDANGVLIGETDCVVPGNSVACSAIRSLAFSDDGLLFVGTSTGYLFVLQRDFSSGFSSAVEDGEAWPPGLGFRVAPLPVDAIFAGTFEH